MCASLSSGKSSTISAWVVPLARYSSTLYRDAGADEARLATPDTGPHVDQTRRTHAEPNRAP